jgi:arylsulfatase A-like enzyme
MIVRVPFHRTDQPGSRDRARERQPGGPEHTRGAPNVLCVVWDDASIGMWSAFGGLVETPTMQWLSGRGLRYSQWHTNALPSVTRCCLLTGRDGAPAGRGQSVIIPQEAGTLAEILGRSGYRTYCVGQWHHSPLPETPAEPRSVATSRRTWPLGRGFDRYYGCLDRQTSPWYPDLVYDNQHVDPPYPPTDGYHLSRDLADMAIEFLGEGAQSAPGQPWLCYLSFGASGVPQAAPQEWAARYRGRFDMGYDRYRQVVLGNMKRLGIVPDDTALAPAGGHPVCPWSSLTDKQRKVSSRLAESAAGLCSYTDHQVGRVLQWLGESGQRSDTIVVVCSANATSAADAGGARTPDGADGARTAGGPDQDWPAPAQAAPAAPAAPGDQAEDDRSDGWAWAFGTPYDMRRQDAVGGSAVSPLIISWPGGMGDVAGSVRDQYHHAVDIVPTILDCAGIDLPRTIRGHVQGPLDGVSMRYTFTAPDAPTARQTQLYRMPRACAIYHAGWKAVASDGPAGTGRWELYHVSADRAEINNVAAGYPEKVAELASLCAAAERRPESRAHEDPGPLTEPWPRLPARRPAHAR